MNLLGTSLAVVAVILAIINWWSALVNKRRTFVISKPGVMLVLLGLFIVMGGYQGKPYWFLLGLTFSLAGDVLLLFPAGWFLQGLVAFFLAQVAYSIGFNQVLPPLLPALAGMLIFAGLFGLIYAALQQEINKKPDLKKMRIPILGYAIMLETMTVSASLSLFKPEWPAIAAAFAVLGGMLFLCSDMMLAYDRFVKRFKHAHILIMMTYHLAQFSIVAAVLVRLRLDSI